MTIDVHELQAFYTTPLGQMTARVIKEKITTLWPHLDHQFLLGMGYPIPYLSQHGKEARIAAFMPAQQGVVSWPNHGQKGLTALVDPDDLPLPDESVDYILLIHGLEHTSHKRYCLRELWRVLKGDGRILVITPNRRSLWAQLDHTPFGQGQPYTMTQLRALLRDNMFSPSQEGRALYTFPFTSRLLLSASRLIESFGSRFLQKFSGVVYIEATKQVYATLPMRETKKTRFITRWAKV